jgi:hypothetical protein
VLLEPRCWRLADDEVFCLGQHAALAQAGCKLRCLGHKAIHKRRRVHAGSPQQPRDAHEPGRHAEALHLGKEKTAVERVVGSEKVQEGEDRRLLLGG